MTDPMKPTRPLSRAQQERLRDLRTGLNFLRGAAGMFDRALFPRASAAIDREIKKITEDAESEGLQP